MKPSSWQWHTRRHPWEYAGLTAADLPALLLAGVSAVTVTAGARLLRGQNSLLMLALGLGVAGATFVLDKLLVERLNSVRPKQSLPALLLCWAPLFLFATSLATVATFSWIVPEIARQDLEHARRAHWTREADKVANYLVLARAALKKQGEASQLAIEAERRRAAAARRSGETYPVDALRQMQRRLVATRDLDKRIPAVDALPLEPPASDAVAQEEMSRAFRAISDVHATALLVLSPPPALPVYEPFTAPSTDVQSVLAEETSKRSWRALTAWGSALWVELLPLLALWRGGQRIPFATRVLNWRCRANETIEALRGSRSATALPIVIEPLQVRGVVRVALSSEYTLNDCAPLLEQAVGSLSQIRGAYQLSRISNTRGDQLDEHRPLMPQLGGQPLVLSVVEAQS